MTVTKGLMYRGGPSSKTSARIAGAIVREFGREDGLAVLDWLIERIQAADAMPNHPVAETIKKEKSRGKRTH